MGQIEKDAFWVAQLGLVSLCYEFGSFPKNLIPPCIHSMGREERAPVHDPARGFDIDFTQFRSVFNYRPVNLDCNEYAMEPETTRELLKRLSKNSLKKYNNEWFTKYEFLKVVKANYYMCSGVMFFITFEVRDPYDNLPKLFQTRVRDYFGVKEFHILCRPKPNQAVKCVGTVKSPKRYLDQLMHLFPYSSCSNHIGIGCLCGIHWLCGEHK
ncbi:LOW QUALITY PROTEIN: uncharacterized protein LOC17895070 [Capsella rubella]|uniref:LOW QUALITY PROTEIN: uncharacterized protein LOC17895070 n=1 Tax=Capsella rubella TaxID=81985 RepID=UPI000CD4B6A5|nr:LOW QUALITY PROTEIN: uncharacterized protein LOC17895070 [Capsella rubella]